MITLAVAGILGASAVGFQGFIQEQTLSTTVNQLLGDLYLTRSEALRRGTTITLCKSRNGTGCSSDAEWHHGWIVFVDPNTNRQVDAGETVIRTQQALSQGTTVRLRAALERNDDVSYHPSGFTDKNGTFTVCDARGTAKARAIILNRAGRARVSSRSAADEPLECQTAAP